MAALGRRRGQERKRSPDSATKTRSDGLDFSTILSLFRTSPFSAGVLVPDNACKLRLGLRRGNGLASARHGDRR